MFLYAMRLLNDTNEFISTCQAKILKAVHSTIKMSSCSLRRFSKHPPVLMSIYRKHPPVSVSMSLKQGGVLLTSLNDATILLSIIVSQPRINDEA